MKRALSISLILAATTGVAAQEPERMTIERLYSMPRLIGTTPSGFAWSPDSKRLAFLWNDEGYNFRDVWTVDVPGGEPVRVTRMPHLEPKDTPSDSEGEIERLEQEVRIERDRGVSEVTWHPNGQHLMVIFRGDLYRVALGGEAQEVRSPPEAESHAAYSPDGKYLGYVSGGDLWMDAASYEGPKNTTNLASEHVSVRGFAFSPDGSSVAFMEIDQTNVPRRGIPDYLPEDAEMDTVYRALPGEEPASRRLGVVPVDGGDIVWMELGPRRVDPIFGYRWSPDNSRLLVDTSDLYVKDRRILSVDAQTGAADLLYREQDPNNIQAYWQVEWAPDGEGVYFISDRDEDYHIYHLAPSADVPKRITQGDWAVAQFAVFDHGIYFLANKGRPEERQIFRADLDGGEPQQLSHRAGTHEPSYSPDGRFAADYFSSDGTPYDLLVTELDPGKSEKERQVTHSPVEQFSRYRWVTPEYVTFPSVVDGVTLTGRLTLPANLDRTKKHPAILGSVYNNTVRNQWGGRTAHPTWGLDQYLAQEGYILLNVNFRGSWGHGKKFRRGIQLDYGGIDTEDIYSGVEYLETLGFVDMDRVGIWGSSYGGLLTCMSLFKKPGVYKAGVAGAPATNVWHATTGEMRVMMAPQDQPEEYANASAFTKAEGLEDHLMIIHGMRDRGVLFRDSVALVQRLMLLGKDVDLVALPDSHHGWDTEGNYQTIFAFNKLVGHFEKYLGKGPSLED